MKALGQPVLQSKAAETAQPKCGGARQTGIHRVLDSPGQPLDLNVRSFLEPRVSHDFSRVRVHSDPDAAIGI